VLERGAFDLDRILEIEPEFLDAGDGHDHHHDHDHSHGHDHHHDPRPQPWRAEALPRRGHAIAVACAPTGRSMRPNSCRGCRTSSPPRGRRSCGSKGILAFSDDDDRYVFQGVHMMLEGDHQRKWKDDERRESRLVFIGRELPEQMIRDGFEGCITT
jgi:G3E family GTPase